MQQQPTQGNGHYNISRAEFESRHAELSAKLSQEVSRIYSELSSIKADSNRQYERLLEEMKSLRKDLATHDALKTLEVKIANNAEDIGELKKEQPARIERFWQRVSPIVTIGLLIVAILELFIHVHIGP